MIKSIQTLLVLHNVAIGVSGLVIPTGGQNGSSSSNTRAQQTTTHLSSAISTSLDNVETSIHSNKFSTINTKNISTNGDPFENQSTTHNAAQSKKSPTSNNDGNNNAFEESMVLLSRAVEVGSVAVATAAPLLVSGISSTVFSNNSKKHYLSSTSTDTTTTTRTTNDKKEDISKSSDIWEKFWSMETSKSTGFSLSSNNNNHDEYNSNTISNAERVVQGLQILGPTYVKFGQALSARPDIIPPSLANALTKLQDDMEPFDTNLAKSIIEKELFMESRIKDTMDIMDDTMAGIGFMEHTTEDVQSLIDSLSEEPVAAASVGQVYKGHLPNYGPVAVKVQRPEVKSLVQKDLSLLRSFASFVESIPAIGKSSDTMIVGNNEGTQTQKGRLINTELVAAVDEFMSRIFEELDYTNEANNAKTFAELYCKKNGSRVKSLPNGQGVIVPQIISSLCTKNVLVMEWIEGSKLTNLKAESNNDDLTQQEESVAGQSESNTSGNRSSDDTLLKENLALVEQALYVTLSQLLDTGVMHADPHGGNLLKVSQFSSTYSSAAMKKSIPTLAYLDFGLLATIPSTVRDGLICAVASLVFAKDVEAVASLFGELDLLPPEVVNDPVERKALTTALTKTMEEVLVYPQGESLFSTPSSIGVLRRSSSMGSGRIVGKKQLTTVPSLRFDKLLDGLTRLVPRFKFRLPPYFINNARALGTLEGIARSLDPEFNCLKLMYPYALYRLLQNPTGSPVVELTLQRLIRSKTTGRVDPDKIVKLLRDTSLFTGYSRGKVLMDILKTKGGKRIVMQSLASEFKRLVLQPLSQRIQRFGHGGRYSTYLKL